ncbi:GNAT family N-acetyltransferase [Nocardioides sp. YIM 152588]|uniref:GNAT family N-acetyltransferase n=1 Tax=Nocardioides sp. YIM 152588 TaxID=3158259 RepID=UPI0032E43C9A
MTSTDLALRPATVADLATVADVFWSARRAAGPAMPPPVHPYDDVVAFFARLDPSAGGTWVAEDDDGVVGFVHLTATWLDHLYVAPRAQGQGVGTALLELAQALRPGGFGLWVFESNGPARAFYARHGLVELARTDGADNEEGMPDIHLHWPGSATAPREHGG